MEKYSFIYLLVFFVKCHIDREWKKMNKIKLNSFCGDQTCEPIKMYVSRMRVALIIDYLMNITKQLLI